MASIGDVFLRLVLDDSDFQAQVQARAQRAGDAAGSSMASSMATQFSRGATQVGRTLDKLGNDLGRTGRSMAASLTLPIVAVGAVVSNLALDFDTAMRKVVGLTDVTEESIDGISESILDMAGAVGKAPQELAEAFYFVASAGFEAAEAMEVLEVAAKASASGLGDTQTIARVLGAALNAYGKENLSAARAADILVEAVSKGTAEASEFAGSLGRVIPIAAQMEVPFEQVAGALAAMTLSGVDADEAVTALRQILVSILKPTVQANEVLSGLGLSAAGLRRQLVEEGLIPTLRTLEERFAGNAEATAIMFGNVRALAGVQNLLGLSAEQLDKVMGDVADSVGRLNEAYEETEGPQRDLDRAMASIKASLTVIGDDALPSVVAGFQGLARALEDVAAWWKKLDPGMRDFIVQSLAITAAVGPLLIVLGALAGALGQLFKAVGVLTNPKSFTALGTRLATVARIAGRIAPWAALVAVLIELPDAVRGVEVAIDGFAKRSPRRMLEGLRLINQVMLANPFGAGLAQANEAVFDEIEREIERSAGHIEGTFAGWGERTGPIVRPVEEAVDLVGEVLEDGSVEIGDAADVMVDPIVDAVAEARKAVAENLEAMLNDIESSLAETPDDIKDEMQAILDALVDPFTDAERVVAIKAALVSGALVDGLTSNDTLLETTTFNQINDWLHQWELVDPTIFDTGAGFLGQLTDGMESNLQTAVDWVVQKMGIDFVSEWDLADQLEAAGYDGLAAYVRGMASVRPTAEEKARELARAARQAALTGADWYGAGAKVVYSFADGMWSGRGYLNDKAQQLKSGLTHILQYADSPPYTHSREIGEEVGLSWADGLVSGLRGLGPTIAGAIAPLSAAMAAPAVMALPRATMPAIGAPGAEGQVVNNYNLNVTGSLNVNEARDAVSEMRRLAGFGAAG